jgi:hypothetical protein
VKTKLLLAIGLIGIAAGAVWEATLHREQADDSAKKAEPAVGFAKEVRVQNPAFADAPVSLEPAVVETAPKEQIASQHVKVASTPVERRTASPANSIPKTGSSKQATAPVAQPKRQELGDPVARVALSFVGEDPDAEAYWVEAINDPNLSAHERSDLIEDLNEEGFEDPHHPTFDDLPIIISRLELIEELAPDAMDEVNSDAFAEAWKDLAKMALVAEQN